MQAVFIIMDSHIHMAKLALLEALHRDGYNSRLATCPTNGGLENISHMVIIVNQVVVVEGDSDAVGVIA